MHHLICTHHLTYTHHLIYTHHLGRYLDGADYFGPNTLFYYGNNGYGVQTRNIELHDGGKSNDYIYYKLPTQYTYPYPSAITYYDAMHGRGPHNETLPNPNSPLNREVQEYIRENKVLLLSPPLHYSPLLCTTLPSSALLSPPLHYSPLLCTTLPSSS
jgi:hypothetical protein